MAIVKLNKQELEVNDLLREWMIDYKAVHVAKVKQWGSDMDKFACVLTNRRNGETETFDFFTGLGHRINNNVKLPQAASLLHSLLLDSQAAEEPFEFWCGNFGYDTDSMKARKTYDACIAIGEQLKKVLSAEQITQLREVLEDY